jgi:hypothetical protein
MSGLGNTLYWLFDLVTRNQRSKRSMIENKLIAIENGPPHVL